MYSILVLGRALAAEDIEMDWAGGGGDNTLLPTDQALVPDLC